MAIRLLLLAGVVMSLATASLAYDFYVGGKDGWVQSPSESYSSWAGRNRFSVGDKLVFKYKKGQDSVLVVSKADFDSCSTSNPIQKLDGGDSTFTFDRSGPFYFISGAPGKCSQGQKLVVVVLAVRNKKPVPAPAPPPASLPPSPTPSLKPPTFSPVSSPVPSLSPIPSPVPSLSPIPSPVSAPTPVPSPVSAPTPSSGGPSPLPSSISPSTAPVSKAPASAPGAAEISPGPSSESEGGAPAGSPSSTPSSSTTLSVSTFSIGVLALVVSTGFVN